MPSRAFQLWTTTRRARLDELYAAHAAVGGANRGRRTATQQINWSIALRISGEFQGYARDLHDEASDELMARTHFTTAAHEDVFRNLLNLNRKLDGGNATPSSLQEDFRRFGFTVLDEIKLGYTRGANWLKALEQLNTARNGIAHSDAGKIAKATGGRPIDLREVRRWDSSARSLVKALDKTVAIKIAAVTSGVLPW